MSSLKFTNKLLLVVILFGFPLGRVFIFFCLPAQWYQSKLKISLPFILNDYIGKVRCLARNSLINFVIILFGLDAFIFKVSWKFWIVSIYWQCLVAWLSFSPQPKLSNDKFKFLYILNIIGKNKYCLSQLTIKA